MKDRTMKRPAAKRFLEGCCLSLILAVVSWLPAAAGGVLPDSGRVIRVADGDTITVRFADGAERRVRLIGVDAPETNDEREEVALRALLSRRFTVYHLYRRDVRLTYDFPQADEHGRVLAYVWTKEGALFNDFIIRQGFASAFLKYPFGKEYQERLRGAEAEARAKERGFWRPDGAAVISVSEVSSRIGEIVSVRFRCAEISKKYSYLYLRSADGAVEALIPHPRLAAFPGVYGCLGKEVIVSGFLERYKGQPQVMLFFPRQLRLT
jgi:micrococcal nuclease